MANFAVFTTMAEMAKKSVNIAIFATFTMVKIEFFKQVVNDDGTFPRDMIFELKIHKIIYKCTRRAKPDENSLGIQNLSIWASTNENFYFY